MSVRLFATCAVVLAAAAVPAAGFEISSPSLVDYKFDKKYLSKNCGGGNLSPGLEWKDPPQGTRSFALTLFDPDANSGGGRWHWQVVRISSKTLKLREGAASGGKTRMPGGAIQLKSDGGKWGYEGPCPPVGSGAHRYVFTLYALKTRNPAFAADAVPKTIADTIAQEAIGMATATYKFGR